MSTRSRIGILNKDKTITSIYCHFDGYLDGVGKNLKNNWTKTAKIDKLMTLGNLSSLGAIIGKKQNFNSPTDKNWCLAYGRDRGESYVRCADSTDLADYYDLAQECYADFAYLWTGKEWNTVVGGKLTKF